MNSIEFSLSYRENRLWELSGRLTALNELLPSMYLSRGYNASIMQRSETCSEVCESFTHTHTFTQASRFDVAWKPQSAQHLDVRNINKQLEVIIKFTCCANENDLKRSNTTTNRMRGGGDAPVWNVRVSNTFSHWPFNRWDISAPEQQFSGTNWLWVVPKKESANWNIHTKPFVQCNDKIIAVDAGHLPHLK